MIRISFLNNVEILIEILIEIFLRSCSKSTYSAGDDLLVDLNGLVSKERRVASSHLVHENSQGPPVHSLVVSLQISQS